MSFHDPRPMRALRGAAAAALLLAAAACGTSGVPASQAPPVGTAAPAAPVPGGLATAQTALGTVVTSDGFTLYRFENDTVDPSRSTCAGECATAWPPLLGDGVPALKGVPQGLVGTVGRSDGTQQLTLGGWPLYRFAKDTAPGSVSGEGVGGTWRAIGVDGKPAAASSAPAPAAAPDGKAPVDEAPGLASDGY
jgi:predicted lipoprotein with Yx(FWY)xxD motif